MKKFKILSVLLISLFMTGCVKLNANMKINKDKSMDYEIIMAFDKSIADQAETKFDDESIKEAEKNGFKATTYNEGSMTGYKFTKHIKNIDSVSTTKNVSGNLDVSSDSKYLFTVKKGFLKNTYKAKLKTGDTDLSNIDTSSISFDNDLDNSLDTTTDTTDTITTDSNTNTNNIDYNSMANMDLKFEVTLPYNAISSNASNTSGKTLTWDLLTFKNDAIEFEFELYNYTNIIIIAVTLFIILVIIVLFLNKKGKKKQENDNNTISIDNNFGQANNISNVEESMQAQEVWNDSNIQSIQPQSTPQPTQLQPNMEQQNIYNQDHNQDQN